MSRRRLCVLLIVPLVAMAACSSGTRAGRGSSNSTTTAPARPLPPRVQIQARPDGIGLQNPKFQPLPGARADYGRLGGTVYKIELPAHWNGRLVLYMEGFNAPAPETRATPPTFRRFLIGQGYAWGASSFSSTPTIPGRAVDETAALWDYFARKYGRPRSTYVIGLIMGGLASHLAAERYANRFNGALALCGTAGLSSEHQDATDLLVAGAYVAGVTRAEFNTTTDIGKLIRERIVPALRDPQRHRRFEDIMIDLTGGPRLFDRDGFEMEEETNWARAESLAVAHLAPNRDAPYGLGPVSSVASEAFNRAAIRLRTNDASLRRLVAGNDTTGNLQMPLLTLHTTGDGQAPIEHARILQRRVDAAGKGDRLVQWVIRDPGHCGFTDTEWEAGLDALVKWVEQGVKPTGTNVSVPDLRRLDRTFEQMPRLGTPEAERVPGAQDRVVVRGNATVDGSPVDARFLGAVVRRNGLITPCQGVLSAARDGRYEIVVLAQREATGCGAPGAEVLLWAFVNGQQLFSTDTMTWPGNAHTATFDAHFSTSMPAGAAPSRSEFSGEVFRGDGRQFPSGTRVEAYVGSTRCGVASTRRAGSYAGYILTVVGPDSIEGCARGATITFRVNGRRATDTAVNNLGGGSTRDLSVP